MKVFTNLLGRLKAPALKRTPTDTVIPLNAHDDTTANRNIAWELTFQFNDVLDADKLATALRRLIEKPGWNTLGARLRLNREGRLEYHIPSRFTPSRPALTFTSIAYNISVFEHPVTAQLPRANGKLEAFQLRGSLSDAIGLKGHGRKLSDWTERDVPQLGLHVCTFTDATFVTLISLHTLFDGVGRKALLGAWRAVLEGREEDVPAWKGYDAHSDALAALGTTPEESAVEGAKRGLPKMEEHVLSGKQVRGVAWVRYVAAMLYENLAHPRATHRILVIPREFLAKLHARALEEAAALPEKMVTRDKRTGKPFVSNGDILLALTVSLLARAKASSTDTTHCVLNVISLRDILSRSADGFPALFPDGEHEAYVPNCTASIASLFSSHELRTLPLGHIAARIRHDLVTQTSRAQVEALHRLPGDAGFAGKIFGSHPLKVNLFTNVSKAGLFQVDFSAAIVEEGSTSDYENGIEQGKGGGMERSGRGKPVYINPRSNVPRGLSVRGSASCTGVDGEGNFWVGMGMREEVGERVDRLVEEMREEMG